jgi:MraZ protein
VLREYAGLKKDVVLVGVRNRLEIWDADMWIEENSDDDIEELAENMAALGLNI